MDHNFKSKAVLVTGSTSGIGLGIARAFCQKGYAVMVNGFGDGDQIARNLEKEFGNKVLFHGANLMNPNECEVLVDACHKAFGGLDVVINNAGIQYVSPTEDFPLEKWDQILSLNLSAPFHIIRKALPKMQENKWGRIINIASAHGLVASTGKSAYVAAKHGLVGLTKVVALENARNGITANAVCPGWVLTPLVQKQIDDNAKASGITIEAATKELLGNKQPTFEFATPEELGDLCVFLASDSAKQMTGSSYSMDGGWTAQ